MKTLPDISDLYPQKLTVSNKRFLRYGKSNILNGEIETVFCTDDNSLVKSILAEDGGGKILVIDAKSLQVVICTGLASAYFYITWYLGSQQIKA